VQRRPGIEQNRAAIQRVAQADAEVDDTVRLVSGRRERARGQDLDGGL
jgi:hypothetical protein